MLKQVFLAHFEPVLTELSPFHHMYAPLCALRTYTPLGMLKQVFLAHFESVVTCFGPWKIPKCLLNGSF